MCRMMLVTGEFDVEEMLNAASDMAHGAFSVANAPTRTHPDGFGIVWADPNAPGGFRSIKDEAPLWSVSPQQIIARAGADMSRTRILAVHTRFALLPHQKGLRFTQPVTAETGQGPVYFMHNGCTPQMHLHLGMSESAFDSEEYFYVAKNLMATDGFEAKLRKLLDGMGADTASANFLMLSQQGILAYNWWPQRYEYPEYAQMHRLEAEKQIIISSEVISTLALKACGTHFLGDSSLDLTADIDAVAQHPTRGTPTRSLRKKVNCYLSVKSNLSVSKSMLVRDLEELSNKINVD